MTILIRTASVEDCADLRTRVLSWPTPTIPLDDALGTRHFIADHDGSVVGCVSVGLAQMPGSPVGVHARWWALAISPEMQGTGLGTTLMHRCLDHAASLGADLAWANARMSALTFYLERECDRVGEPFIDPITGLTDQRIAVAVPPPHTSTA